jgi:hypothetical protein
MSIHDLYPARRILPRTFEPDDLAAIRITEDTRRKLELECARAKSILTSAERERIAAFDRELGIGFKPPVRR